MICVKCRKKISDNSAFCQFCGKKQGKAETKYHKREHGSGTISRDKRNRRQWIAHAPSTRFGNGRAYLGSFSTRAEAANAIEEYVKAGSPSQFNATLGDIYELWSAEHYKSVSFGTEKNYRSQWKHLEPLANSCIRDLKAADFQAIINSIEAKTSACKVKVLAQQICDYAIKTDIINKNYADYIAIPKVEKKERKIFSESHRLLLWQNSDKKEVQIVLFMIYTGFRIGEMCDLRVENIHLDEGYLIGGLKTSAGKNRVVPLSEKIPELSEWLAEWVDEWKEKGNGKRLFQKRTFEFRDEIFDKAMVICGIDKEGYTPHCTRHTFASLSVSSGIRAEELQKIIGHSNFSTTADIYVHADIKKLKEEMNKMEK